MSRARTVRRSRREEIERQAWLKQAEQWDGTAHVFNPFDRTYEPADVYQAKLAAPMMKAFDRLPPSMRCRVADSQDGYF